MERTLFREEHELFRQGFRRFVEREVKPHQARWAETGVVDRELWRKAGAAGFLCPWLDTDDGGPGGDFLHSVVVMEELARAYESGWAVPLHSDIIVPYLHEFGTAEQRRRWLPGCARGDLVTAIAMTEPGAGSDLAAIKTSAVRDGDDYLISGTKTFISNALLCDLCIVAARTDRGITLFVVEAGTPGFIKGRKLAKLGLTSQDTAELHFDGCRVPAAHRLGEEGAGFKLLMRKLQQERLVVAIMAHATAETVLSDTLAYVKERQAFGKTIGSFQNTQFQLAECATQVTVGRAFLDRVIAEHMTGKSLVMECSMAKLWQAEMVGRVTDTCLQLFGGYGYMLEYPVARAFVDARVARIYAGTSEIMKLIIARQLGLGD